MSSNASKGRQFEHFSGQEIVIGKVVSVNIPKREVRIAPETSHPERFHELRELRLRTRQGATVRLVVDGMRSAGGAIVAKVDVEDDDLLASTRKSLVIVSREDRYKLPENEYYVDDLVGLLVKDATGAIIGRLSGVFETPANDVYQVIDEAGHEILLPAIEGIILKVDVERGEMTADISDLIED